MGRLIVNGKTNKCCGLRSINLGMCKVDLVKVEVFIVDRKLLESDLLFGINSIKVLSSIQIIQSGTVCFTKEEVQVCETIQIDKLNFSVSFDDK